MKIVLYVVVLTVFCLFISYKIFAQERIITFLLDAPQLNTTKKIWVYLPLCYNKNETHFPVIYMHDGQNLFDTKTAYAGSWYIEKKLDSIKANVIVVGIEHGGEKRIEELTPFKNEKYHAGKGDLYQEFITKTLKPHIDRTYRTKPNAEDTYLMGSSLGGLMAFYYGLKQPEIFGKIGVFSPAFWINRKDILETLTRTQKIKTKFYFICGDNEGDPDMITDFNLILSKIKTHKILKDKQIKSEIIARGKHNEEFWGKEFIKVYLWLSNNNK